MSVDELQPRRPPRPPGDAKLVRYDEYIDKQIRSTSRAVKAVEFATALVVLFAAVLAFLLTAAVVEHWLVPGGFNFAVRYALFGVLVAGAGYYAYRRLWPLCLRAINPVYAAQTIEHGSPSLKNSLINLLLFRQRRADISEAVYQTLEEQAAQRLTRVPTDSSVDRTQLIRFGYVLLAIVAAAALYKVFSPKDPIIAAERVLLPWVDIVPAARVSIANVEPGAVTVTRGEFIDVSAEVLGINENDPVQLRVTTADGRAVDKPIAMKLTNTGVRFVGRLPDASDAVGSSGVAQNLTYRIEAGDARTLDYPVTVIAAPAILVERIDYDYPEYTGYADRTEDASHGVPDPGHIRAIEGTKVTIHARANGPIRTAEVDFDADGRRDLEMSRTGDRAKATFELALRDDRQTPKHLSYVLRLTNDEGRANRDPVKYPIETLPDLAPEVEITAPAEKSLDVRLDDTIVIELKASDPDFGLSAVQLRGEAPGRPKLDVSMLEKKPARKFAGKYRFKPSEHQLKAGDIVQYWVAADDIRTPKANSTATEKRTFRIVSPDPANQPPPNRIAQRDKRQQPNEQQGQQGQEKQQDGRGKQGAEGNQGGENGEQQQQQQQGKSGGEQGNSSQSKNNKQQQGQGRDSDSGEGQEGDGQEGEGNSADGKESGESDGKSQGKNANQDGGKNGGKGGGKNGVGDDPARSQGENQQGSESDGKQTGAGASGGESQKGSQPAGTRPEQREKRQGGGKNERGTSDSKSEPVSSQGDDDGSAFERIREHMQRKGELKENESESKSPNASESRNGNSDSADGKPKQPGESTAKGDQKQNGSEQSPTGDAQEQQKEQAGGETGRRAQRGEQKGDAAQQEKGTEAGSAENKEPRTEDQGEGTGADTRQDDLQGRDKPPSESGEKTKSPGGQQTSTKGPSGAGEQPGENQGAPDSKEGMKPADKRQQSPSQESKTDDKEPPAPGEGKRESDSQGDQGGDRPGGGEEGGGQKANRDGTGSAGQNQSADEGAGESSEKGAGNNSPNAGQDATADRRTGQPGSEKKGPGSGQREGQGDKAGGKAENKDGDKNGVGDDPARSDEKPQQGNQPGKENKPGETAAEGKRESQEGTKPSGGPGAPTGSGGDTGTAGAPPPVSGSAPDGDAANLEYARRQTDLVLEKVADQLKRKKVDEGMLKELGWTEEELRSFVKRWQQRKEAARNANPASDAARRELDDALRSLGLRRGELRQNNVKEDTDRNLREGYRGPVPPEYRERLRAYNQGVSRAQEGE